MNESIETGEGEALPFKPADHVAAAPQPEALRLAAELDVGDFDVLTNYAAAAELRRLHAENEALRSLGAPADPTAEIHSCSHLCTRPGCVEARELEAMRKDAERYRWLTDDHPDIGVRRVADLIAKNMIVRGKGATDAAIDAAIDAAKGEGHVG